MNDVPKLTHHPLTVECFTDEQGPAIILEQQSDGMTDPNTVICHPWQLRAVCEQFGLAGSGDAQARKTIATLERRLQKLRDRIEHLDHWLWNLSDSDHADLDYERTYSQCTRELAEEFCFDVGGLGVGQASQPPAGEAPTAEPIAVPAANTDPVQGQQIAVTAPTQGKESALLKKSPAAQSSLI